MLARCEAAPARPARWAAGAAHCTAGENGAWEQPWEARRRGRKTRGQAGQTKVCMLKSLLLEQSRGTSDRRVKLWNTNTEPCTNKAQHASLDKYRLKLFYSAMSIIVIILTWRDRRHPGLYLGQLHWSTKEGTISGEIMGCACVGCRWLRFFLLKFIQWLLGNLKKYALFCFMKITLISLKSLHLLQIIYTSKIIRVYNETVIYTHIYICLYNSLLKSL